MEPRLPQSLRFMPGLVLVGVALACSSDGPGAPSEIELPITWTFDTGLEGWAPGITGSDYPFGSATQADGMVVLEGAGEVGTPNAWVSRSVSLPEAPAVLAFRARARCVHPNPADTDVRVRVEQGGSSTEVIPWTEVEDTWTTVSASLAQFAGAAVRIVIEIDDNNEQEDDPARAESLCIDEITIAEVS